jgi:hypothetical protein
MPRSRDNGVMRPSPGLVAASAAFAAEAATVDPDAPVRSEIWPTAGRMIDHLGNIQGWASEVVRTGALADRKEFRRPPDRDLVEWFTETSAGLIAAIEAADGDEPCWALFDTSSTTSFWNRRMTGEAAKHLWDLRTATEPTPVMPPELGPGEQADVIDEFIDVFLPPARVRGIEPLPGDVALVATDVDRAWMFSRDWHVTRLASAEAAAADADQLHAAVGDLTLIVWERADPWAMPDRFRMGRSDDALRRFAGTSIHL